MATRTIAAGKTVTVQGTLSAGSSLYLGSGGDGTAVRGALLRVPGTLTNNGTITLLANPATQKGQNETGGTLDVTGTLLNNGSIVLAGGSPSQDYPPHAHGAVAGGQLNNSGTLTNAGLISIGGAVVDTYQQSAGAAAVLRDTGVLSNTGTLLIQGTGNSYASTSGGTLSVAGSLTNAGLLDVRASYSQGPGAYLFDIRSDQAGQLEVQSHGVLANTGQLMLHGGAGSAPLDGLSVGSTLEDGGVLSNTGTITVGGGITGASYRGYGAALIVMASGTLANGGLLSLRGGEAAAGVSAPGNYTGATLSNSGVLANAGTISIGASGPSASFQNTPGGALLSDSGRLSNAGTILVLGAPAYYGDQGIGGTLLVSGSLSNAGLIVLAAGVHSPGDRGGVGNGGWLMDTGTLTNTGSIMIAGSIMDFPHEPDQSGTLFVEGSLTNIGTLDVQGGQGPASPTSHPVGGQVFDSGTFDNRGAIVLEAGLMAQDGAGTFTISGTLTNTGTFSGGGVLANEGTLFATGTTGVIDTALQNSGMVFVTAGASLRVGGAVSYYGQFDISAGATLTLDARVGSGGEVSFLAAGGTLALGDAVDFKALVDGLRPDATIDFLGEDVVGAAATGSMLTLTLENGGTLSLALSAPLPAADQLSLSGDGHGGTNLLILGAHSPAG